MVVVRYTGQHLPEFLVTFPVSAALPLPRQPRQRSGCSPPASSLPPSPRALRFQTRHGPLTPTVTEQGPAYLGHLHRTPFT